MNLFFFYHENKTFTAFIRPKPKFHLNEFARIFSEENSASTLTFVHEKSIKQCSLVSINVFRHQKRLCAWHFQSEKKISRAHNSFSIHINFYCEKDDE
jgi:hypothetical protein